jgi:hypothetical protein
VPHLLGQVRQCRLVAQKMTSAAARMKILRQRARNGVAVVSVEINLRLVTKYLVDAELLQPAQVDDRQAIGIAIRNLLDLLMADQRLRP